MNRVLPVTVLVLAAACAPQAPLPALRTLEAESLAPVRDAFNAAADRTRVVALLSPT